MPRKRLPWDIKLDTTIKTEKQSTSRPAKRVKRQLVKSEPQDEPFSSPTRPRTSASPPTPERMRPGWDQDDMYMMVEDTFNAIANSFTSHLHHAELLRLQEEARNNRASGTNVNSSLRAQPEQRQRPGIKTEHSAAAVEEDEVIDDVEAIPVFAGTPFARFLKKDKQKINLTALERPQPATRAAQGFSDRQEEQRIRRIEREQEPDVLSLPQPKAIKQERRDRQIIDLDDDDLDLPSNGMRQFSQLQETIESTSSQERPSQRSIAQHFRPSTERGQSAVPVQSVKSVKSFKSFKSSTQPVSSQVTQPRASVLNVDLDFDDDFLPIKPRPRIVPLKSRQAAAQQRIKTEKEVGLSSERGKNRVNEVPLFLG